MSGIAIMLATTAFFAASDATTKLIGTAIPLLVMLWCRYLFQTIVLGVLLVRRGRSGMCFAAPPRLQVLRAVLLMLNSAATFGGVRHLPLAVTTALAMMAPLITTLLAATLLGEAVSGRKWVMVATGFSGMLMIVRPGGQHFSWGGCLPITAATTFACFQVVSSRLSRSGDPVATNFLTGLIVTSILSVLALASQATLLPAVRQSEVGRNWWRPTR